MPTLSPRFHTLPTISQFTHLHLPELESTFSLSSEACGRTANSRTEFSAASELEANGLRNGFVVNLLLSEIRFLVFKEEISVLYLINVTLDVYL